MMCHSVNISTYEMSPRLYSTAHYQARVHVTHDYTIHSISKKNRMKLFSFKNLEGRYVSNFVKISSFFTVFCPELITEF